jgi:hypothetical protein
MVWAVAAGAVALLYAGMAVYFYYGFKHAPL